jgi:hypothetical protein
MTALTNLRDEIKKHPAGSDTARILAWADVELGERADCIFELEDEIKALRDDKLRRVTTLNNVRDTLIKMADYILKENFDLPCDTFAKDFAPFKNVMAHHGVEPYVKPKKARKVAA